MTFGYGPEKNYQKVLEQMLGIMMLNLTAWPVM